MKIGEVARHAGLPASTLRYYERIGLIPAPRRISGQRAYDESILDTLRYIRHAQAIGYSLDEIKTLLDRDALPDVQLWKATMSDKMRDVQAKIQQFQHQLELIQRAMACPCTSLETCELI